MATLYILAGLPGTGKTTISQLLARKLHALHLRIDTIEQAIRDLGIAHVQDEGYRLAYRLAADNLRLGASVVADSCNPIDLTRRSWEQVAQDSGAVFINIEVVCSDCMEHRRRVESRTSNIPGLHLPTWQDVEQREYHGWTQDRIIIDTAKRTESDCLEDLMRAISTAC